MTDFSRPGHEGVLPSNAKPWEWGVAYTLWRDAALPWTGDREFRMTAIVRQRITRRDHVASYADIYGQALKIVDARAAGLQRSHRDTTLEKWVIEHGWGCLEGDEYDMPTAWITMGVAIASDTPRLSCRLPSIAALAMPRSDDPAAQQQIHPNALDEIYIGFDFRDKQSRGSNIFTFSYGEHSSCAKHVNFEPFVRRAETRAKAHQNSFIRRPSSIVRRDWMHVTSPDLVVVHIYSKI